MKKCKSILAVLLICVVICGFVLKPLIVYCNPVAGVLSLTNPVAIGLIAVAVAGGMYFYNTGQMQTFLEGVWESLTQLDVDWLLTCQDTGFISTAAEPVAFATNIMEPAWDNCMLDYAYAGALTDGDLLYLNCANYANTYVIRRDTTMYYNHVDYTYTRDYAQQGFTLLKTPTGGIVDITYKIIKADASENVKFWDNYDMYADTDTLVDMQSLGAAVTSADMLNGQLEITIDATGLKNELSAGYDVYLDGFYHNYTTTPDVRIRDMNISTDYVIDSNFGTVIYPDYTIPQNKFVGVPASVDSLVGVNVGTDNPTYPLIDNVAGEVEGNLLEGDVTNSPTVDLSGVFVGIDNIISAIAQIPVAIDRFFDLTLPIDLAPLQIAGNTFVSKFPFCIPWDLYGSFSSLAVAEEDVIIHLDLQETPLMPAWNLDIEFSQFASLLAVAKAIELLCFDIGLILIANKLLGGGN